MKGLLKNSNEMLDFCRGHEILVGWLVDWFAVWVFVLFVLFILFVIVVFCLFVFCLFVCFFLSSLFLCTLVHFFHLVHLICFGFYRTNLWLYFNIHRSSLVISLLIIIFSRAEMLVIYL